MLSVIVLNGVMLNDVMLSVVMLSVVKLSVVMLSAIVPQCDGDAKPNVDISILIPVNTLRAQCYTTFYIHNLLCSKSTKVFVLCMPFQPSLMLVGQTRSLTLE